MKTGTTTTLRQRIAGPAGSWLLTAVVVSFCAVAPWVGTLRFPFLLDDNMAVVDNPLVDGRKVDLHRIFTTTGWGDVAEYHHVANYRPLATATLAVTRRVAGLDPVPFRLTNLVLYCGLCLLLLWLMRVAGCGPAASGLAAAWFALHGTHVETVMFVVNREILLATSFYIGGLILVMKRSALVAEPRRWSPGALAGLAAVTLLGLLSKESAITMPFVATMIILLARPSDRPIRATLAPIAAMLLAGATYFVVRVNAVGRMTASAIPWQDNPLVLADTPARLAGAMDVMVLAGRLLTAPFRMTVDYGFDVLGLPGPPPGAPPLAIAGGIAIIAAGIALLVVLTVRKSPAWPGVAMMALTWGLVSSIVFPSWVIIGERLLTEPSAGMALAMAVGLGALFRLAPRGHRLRWVSLGTAGVFAVWIAAMTMLTVDRISDYRSAESLFQSSLTNRPGSTRLHNNLGKVMMDSGRWAQAEPYLRAAIAIDPANAEAHNNLGLVLGNAGLPGSAAAELQEALRHRPNMPAALTNLCILLVNQGRFDDALPICEKALARGGQVEPQIARCRSR